MSVDRHTGTDRAARERFLMEEWFPAMVASDIPALRSMLTEDAEFWMPRSVAAAAGKPRPVKGREGCLAIFGATVDFFFVPESRSWRHEALLIDGEWALVHAEMTATTSIGGDYVNDYMILFRFAGDRVSEFWEINDTAGVIRQWEEIVAVRGAAESAGEPG